MKNKKMTDKITLELTLDELKTLDKHIEYNEETKSVFDKIKYAYPQPKMTLANSGFVESVYYNNEYYYRIHFGPQCLPLWLKVNGNDMNTIMDAETERLLEGLYYNHIEVKKEKEMIRQNLKTSLKELANGDVRPIDDVIEEAKEEQTKTPCEIAYKDWWGEYPTNTWQSDVNRWEAFKMGYNAAYKKPEEPVSFAPKEIKELVKEGLEWCENHPNENPLDYLTPKTPEETAESLKEAFREAQQTEKWKEIQQKIDDGEFNDFIFIDRPNLLDFLKDKLGYSTDSCYEIVDVISEWLPETQNASGSQNAYVESAVEGWNDAINAIRGKLQ